MNGVDSRRHSAVLTFPEAQARILDTMERGQNYNAWLFARARKHLGSRVLDFGAGIGTFTALAAREADFVVAVEPDPTLFPRLRDRFAGHEHVRVVQSVAGGLTRRPDAGDFDSVICFNVLEHVRDDVGTLAELRGLLTGGGKLLLLVPAHPALFGATDRAVAHERRYSRSGLTSLLRRAGFEIDDARYVNPIGAVGWLVSSVLLRRSDISGSALSLYDRLVPALRILDRIQLPFGLSVWAVARRIV